MKAPDINKPIEVHVSFELAMLLKDIGFNERCEAVYDPNTKVFLLTGPVENKRITSRHITAPSQATAIAWLWKNYNILLQIEPVVLEEEKVVYNTIVYSLVKGSIGRSVNGYYHSPETAINDTMIGVLKDLTPPSAPEQ